MRLFAAIPLPAVLTSELTAVSLQLQASDDGMRWSAAESWHITLQFLGATNLELFDCIGGRLRELHMPAISIRLGPLGFFDRAGVFFAGVELTPGLELLQQRVSEATNLCGFIPETRPYHPHITLARSKAKGNGRVREMKALRSRIKRVQRFTPFMAEEFVLYESVMAPGGSIYEVRDRFCLQN